MMTKWRFFLLVATLPAIIILMVLALVSEPFWIDFYFIFLIIHLFLQYWLRRTERKKITAIHFLYVDNLEPLQYLEAYEKFNKKRILFKNMKLMDKITKCQVLLDAGAFEECRKIMEDLVDQEVSFSALVRFLYYKNWIIYFEEVNDIQRMKFLLDQIRDLLEKIPLKYRQQLTVNYKMLEARYFTAEGIFLETAESRYQQILQTRLPRIVIMHSIYQLGIIAYKLGRYDEANKRLNSVLKNGKGLHLVHKAQEILEKFPN